MFTKITTKIKNIVNCPKAKSLFVKTLAWILHEGIKLQQKFQFFKNQLHNYYISEVFA